MYLGPGAYYKAILRHKIVLAHLSAQHDFLQRLHVWPMYACVFNTLLCCFLTQHTNSFFHNNIVEGFTFNIDSLVVFFSLKIHPI